MDASTLRSFQPPCQCSSIQFGTVAEVLDRNSLQIMDPPDFGYPSVELVPAQQDVEAESRTFGAPSIHGSSLNDGGLAMEIMYEGIEYEKLTYVETNCREPDFGYHSVEEAPAQQDVEEELRTFETPSIHDSSLNDRGLTMKIMGEAIGNEKLTYVETKGKKALDVGTKYEEILHVSGESNSVKKGLEISLNVQERNRPGTFKGQGENNQRLKHFQGVKVQKNCCKLDDESRPRLKGGARKEKIKIKYFESKMEKFNIVLNLLRSSKSMDSFNKHKKCEPSLLCSFCLLRSLMLKINNPKGRQAVIPVEIECQHFSLLQPVSSLLNQVIARVNASYPEFKNAISPTWYCTCCNTSVGFSDECFINLNHEIKNKKLDELIGIKYNSLLKDHREKKSLDGNGTMEENHELIFGNEQKTCQFYGSDMQVNLQEILTVGGKLWKCVGATNGTDSFFRINNEWFMSSKNDVTKLQDFSLENISLVSYDRFDIGESQPSDEYCYVGKDLTFFRNKMDRHLDNPKRKEDRHLDKPKRKEDRHLDKKEDRHLDKKKTGTWKKRIGTLINLKEEKTKESTILNIAKIKKSRIC